MNIELVTSTKSFLEMPQATVVVQKLQDEGYVVKLVKRHGKVEVFRVIAKKMLQIEES